MSYRWYTTGPGDNCSTYEPKLFDGTSKATVEANSLLDNFRGTILGDSGSEKMGGWVDDMTASTDLAERMKKTIKRLM